MLEQRASIGTEDSRDNQERRRPAALQNLMYRLRLQTSLRTLLIVAIASGAVAGLFGPDIARAVRELRSPPPPTLPPIPAPPAARFLSEEESNGYFESAETPLR